ncbi:FMN-binding protein [Desulfitobacterium sp. PCE1]|uniref:FMN-binding protein n=1 Tax=Desulfitobacterium sp. PCE1 TaxID=146907 RepID=UPI00035CA538|nr:FMN-binding protein [Desulfitobacterium sp. PCE1]
MKKKYLLFMSLLILAASVIVYKVQAGGDYLPKMREMAGQGSEVKQLAGEIYEASQQGEITGYFNLQSAIGYAGPVDVLVFIDKEGQLKKLEIVQQTETPSFFNKVMSVGFVDNILGKKANSQFELGQDLDGVTNATFTSRAIAEAVRKASHTIAMTQLNMEVPQTTSLKLSLEHYLLLGLLFAVFLFQKFKLNKLRNVTLIAGFLLIGYWQKALLTLGNIASVISGNISWQNMPFWLILLIGVFALILITGRNLYCYWICPYGALSELLGAFGRFSRTSYKPCERSIKRFKHLRLFLAWIALVFAFLMMNPSISSYEIFAPLFAWEGTAVQWLMLPVMLFAGVFILRIWCRFFCPVGGILDFLVTCRRSCVQWIDSKVMKNKLSQKQLRQIQLEPGHQEKA